MEKIIIFLIRKRLGLKKWQTFYFKNQANKTDRYFFEEDRLMKQTKHGLLLSKRESNMRLNFLLSDSIFNLLVKENE